MRRLFLQCLNGLLLVVVLVGVPAITSKKFGTYQISSLPAWERLTLWGLAVGAVLNFLGAVFLLRKNKERRICWWWGALHLAIFVVEYLLFRGQINFHWLENALRGLGG